jgi:PHD/YefM family antitoxin component YafN of YafNO toxin-antitoxin module
MNISTKAIVSNSEMTKNYKACRETAESTGKIFILKNNQPDAVLFSINEYERFAALIEYLETLEDDAVAKIVETIPKEGIGKTYSANSFKIE